MNVNQRPRTSFATLLVLLAVGMSGLFALVDSLKKLSQQIWVRPIDWDQIYALGIVLLISIVMASIPNTYFWFQKRRYRKLQQKTAEA